jgi:hypothetical protein
MALLVHFILSGSQFENLCIKMRYSTYYIYVVNLSNSTFFNLIKNNNNVIVLRILQLYHLNFWQELIDFCFQN